MWWIQYVIRATVLVVLFTSCSIFFEPVIPSEVQPYITEFIDQGAMRGIEVNEDRIKVVFKHMEDKNGLGCHCVRHKITLDPDWYDYNDWEKRWLVFHEAGHAILGRGHSNYRVNYAYEGYWRWSSIMAKKGRAHDTQEGFNHFEMHYSEYMDELFGSKTKSVLYK